MAETILDVRGLEKWYGAVKAVDQVSFDLHRGEVLTLLGPSGCGKSTTLRLVAGLEQPDAGQISVQGRVVACADKRIFVPAEKRNVGLVFQSYAIWPHMTVFDNVAYPLTIRRVPRADVARKVRAVLSLVGLAGLEQRPATHLSGGQQQRVALARALAYEPDLLLLDEPLSNLDAKLREEMRVQLRALQSRLGTTILYVTHDQVEAMSLSHQVAVMRNGRIEQLGPPAAVYESPATYFVQSFVGRTLAFEGVVRRDNGVGYVQLDEHADLRLAAADLPADGSRVRVTVRPEDVSLEPFGANGSSDGLRAMVEDLIYCGDHLECALRVGRVELVLHAPKQLALARGQEAVLTFNPARVKAWPA